jgi:hypothetical protein
MNVKDFSKTIVLAEAVSANLSYEECGFFGLTHAFTPAPKVGNLRHWRASDSVDAQLR